MSVAALYAAIFSGFLNLFLQIPLTPVHAWSLAQEPLVVALAVSAYSIANMVGNLACGLVVDRFSKRPVLVAGLAAGGVALALAGLVAHPAWLIGCLMLNGLAFSVVSPAAYALLGGNLTAESRAGGMARSGAAIGVAALVGPPVAGALADRLGAPGAYAVAGLAMVAVGLVLAGLLRAVAEVPQAEVTPDDYGAILADRRLDQAFLAAFVLMFANGSLILAVPPLVRAMGLPGAAIGGLFSTFALVAIGVFLTPLGRLAYQARSWQVIGLGAALVSLSLAGLAFAPGLPLMVACMGLYGLGFALIFPAAIASLMAAAPEDKRGTAFGLFYALFSLGAAAGPLVLAHLGGMPLLWAAALPAMLAGGQVAIGFKRSGENA